MEDKLKTAIESLADKIAEAKTAIEAQQYAQAALNTANALIGLRLNPKK